MTRELVIFVVVVVAWVALLLVLFGGHLRDAWLERRRATRRRGDYIDLRRPW